MSRGKSGERYSLLAVDPVRSSKDVRDVDVAWYRTKTVYAGPMLYVSCFPVFRHSLDLGTPRGVGTREAQQIVNRRHTAEKLEQYIHANFDTRDLFLTLTYRETDARIGDDEVRRDAQKYVRRLRSIAAKRGTELKYIYVMELPERQDTDNRGYRESMGWHLHMVLSGVTREDAEEAWEHGFANSRRLQDSKERFTGISKYIMKRRSSWRSWAKSRNLIPPVTRVQDRRPGKAKVRRMADDVRAFGREIFEKMYPGYSLIEDVLVKTSQFVPGAYLYARMRSFAEEKGADYDCKGNTGCTAHGGFGDSSHHAADRQDIAKRNTGGDRSSTPRCHASNK